MGGKHAPSTISEFISPLQVNRWNRAMEDTSKHQLLPSRMSSLISQKAVLLCATSGKNTLFLSFPQQSASKDFLQLIRNGILASSHQSLMLRPESPEDLHFHLLMFLENLFQEYTSKITYSRNISLKILFYKYILFDTPMSLAPSPLLLGEN